LGLLWLLGCRVVMGLVLVLLLGGGDVVGDGVAVGGGEGGDVKPEICAVLPLNAKAAASRRCRLS